MLVGACWPYRDQQPAPEAAWALAEQLGLQAVRIMSNAAPEDYARLHAAYPALRWVVRCKLPKLAPDGRPYVAGDQRPALLDYREWPSEPSLRETIARLNGWGITPDVELLNEPDIEWDEALSWGPAAAWERAARDCRNYLLEQVAALRGAGCPIRLIAPALSQGWPERHDAWLELLQPLFEACDGVAVHAYTDGRPFDDPGWGGRPLAYRQRFPGQPLLLTETNDNGHPGAAAARGVELGAYLRWLAETGAVELACLFALPGGDGPGWWGLTPDVVAGTLAGLAGTAALPETVAAQVPGAIPSAPGGVAALADRLAIPAEGLLEAPRPVAGAALDGAIGVLERKEERSVPEFRLGMAAKARELGAEVVGDPLEDEWYPHPDLAVQFTSQGVMLYSKRANRVHFLPARQ
jgi:hypothetical protein